MKLSDNCIVIYDFDKENRRRHKILAVRKDFAKTFLNIDIEASNIEFVVTPEAYEGIWKKVEMAERACPGMALWKEKDEKTVQE